MRDDAADEIVPQRRRGDRIPLIDKVLGLTGIALAIAATYFPWYAFLHRDEFSMPALWRGSTRDVPAKAGPSVQASSPLAMTDRDAEIEAAVDQLVTATVPGPQASAKKPAPQDDLAQPFPSAAGFRLMHVANGRALIEDGNGMYIVRIGSVLPDNSRLATLEQRKGRWIMITSNGDIYHAE